MKSIVLAIVGLVAGIAAAYFVASEEAPMALRKVVHAKPTMEIMGFQPFWLLDQADSDYSSYASQLTYFGLQLADDGTIRKLNTDVEQEPGWSNLNTTRVQTMLQNAKKEGVVLSLAVQNANEESIDSMMQDPVAAAYNLINDIEPIVKANGFTDINLDIESFVDVPLEKQQAFTLFVETISHEVRSRKLGTISIDITPMSLIRQRLTSANDIVPFVNTVILMAYDYTYIGSYSTGPVAPVDGAGEVRELDIESSLQELLRVAPKEKVLLGIPTYGYEWETISAEPGAAVIPGTGKTASAKRVDTLRRTCTQCKEARDPVSKQPYLIIKEQDYYRQLFYVDNVSLRTTLQLAESYNLAGVAIWAFGYETQSMRDELSLYR